MPAQHLLPDMEERVLIMVRNRVFGKRQVRDEAIIPTIKAFGFRDVSELKSVAGKLVDKDGKPLSTSDSPLNLD
jgi:hypothetical protein